MSAVIGGPPWGRGSRARGDVLTGLAIGLALTAWITVLRLIGGARAFEVRGTTYPSLAVFYICSGVVTGIAVAMSRPYVHGPASRTVAAVTSGLPLALAMGICFVGPPNAWTTNDKISVLFFELFSALILGRQVFQKPEAE